MKKFICLMLCLLLTACMPPFKAEEYVANRNIYPGLNKSRLASNVQIVLTETKDPVVSPEELKRALEMSFDKAGWLKKSGSPRYNFSASFQKFQVPFAVFNTQIIAYIEYKMLDTRTGKYLYHETVHVPCTKGMGEIWDGAQRQIATAKCALSENITHLIRDLNSKF